MATTKPSAADRLKKAATTSVRKETTKTKDRPVWPLTPDQEVQVAKLCELAYLNGEVDPLVTQHKTAVGAELFNIWTQRFFESKMVPENPDFVIKKKDAKTHQPTALDDMGCQLQIKFRTDGLQKVLPDKAKLPEGETVEEKLIEALMSPVVGLTETNAKKFVEEEVLIADNVELAMPLNEMLSNDKYALIAEKLLTYMQTRPKNGTDIKVVALTEEEEALVLSSKQSVSLKEGLFQRILGYVENIDQLRKLLLYIRITIQVSKFEFGKSDTDADRVNRLKNVVQTYLLPAGTSA